MELQELISNLGSIRELMQEVKELRVEVNLLRSEISSSGKTKELLTSKDVMKLLDISEPTLIKYENQKKIKYKKLKHKKYYFKHEVLAFMDKEKSYSLRKAI